MSTLGHGLLHFLEVWAPQGRQALPLTPVDLPALEASLLHFLDELGHTTSHLVVGGECRSLRMWIFAAAGAGAACLIAYRQQRHNSDLCLADIAQLPGCSSDDDG